MQGRQFARWQFDRRYAKLCRDRGKYQAAGATDAAYRRGCDTRWAALQGILRASHARGSGFKTTNGQRAAQLVKDGRPRVERTVRRSHRDLEEMGYVDVKHVKRSGAARRRGELDCLAIIILDGACVRPPFGEPEQEAGPLKGPASVVPAQATSTAENDLSPPASPADDVGGPAAAGRPDLTQREQLESEIGFLQLKLDRGWTQPRIPLELARLQQELRCLAPAGPGSPPTAPQGSDGPDT